MNPKLTTEPEPTEQEIQHQAYLLWLESGRAPDRDLSNWLEARELLRHRHALAHAPRSPLHPGTGISHHPQ